MDKKLEMDMAGSMSNNLENPRFSSKISTRIFEVIGHRACHKWNYKNRSSIRKVIRTFIKREDSPHPDYTPTPKHHFTFSLCPRTLRYSSCPFLSHFRWHIIEHLCFFTRTRHPPVQCCCTIHYVQHSLYIICP